MLLSTISGGSDGTIDKLGAVDHCDTLTELLIFITRGRVYTNGSISLLSQQLCTEPGACSMKKKLSRWVKCRGQKGRCSNRDVAVADDEPRLDARATG
jgi:hypothetical protein